MNDDTHTIWNPGPGIYRDIPFADYVRHPGINATTLKKFGAGSNAKHGKHLMDNDKPETACLVVGHASHTAVLEPDKLDKDYAVFPDMGILASLDKEYKSPRASKEYKEAKAAWYDAHEGQSVLTAGEYDRAVRTREACEAHPVASALLFGGQGLNELTAIGEIKVPGEVIFSKARIDRLTEYNGMPCLVDLKTIDPGKGPLTQRLIDQQMHKFKYHQQVSWYMGVMQNVKPVTDGRVGILVFVQSGPPYDVACFEVGAESIYQGQVANRRAVDTIMNGRATGLWPGFSDSMMTAQLPDYAFDADELDLTGIEEL